MIPSSRSRFSRRASPRFLGMLAGIGVMLPAMAMAQSGAPNANPPSSVEPVANAGAAVSPEQPIEVPAGDHAAATVSTTPAPATPAADGQTVTQPALATAGSSTAADEAAAAAIGPDAPGAVTESAVDLAESSIDVSPLNFYGFTDVGFTMMSDSKEIGHSYSTFMVGNMNLYMATDLGSNWRGMSEVRFMYLPDGAYAPDSYSGPRTDTTTADYTNTNKAMKWGGISIQRAWIEHTFNELLTLRFGQFLTPYGIWNVDHGSPVIIGVRRPYMIGDRLFPETQTGVEGYGSVYVKATQFGYHLTLSNGRGPVDTYRDLDHNKAIGGRFFVRTEGDFGTLSIGASGYRGRYTDRASKMVFGAGGAVTTVDPATLEYSELSLAADIKWELKGLLVQSEAALNDVAYGSARPTALPNGGPTRYLADHRGWGFYALTGFRTPWWNIMPFVGGEYRKDPTTRRPLLSGVGSISGLRLAPS
jgi:hypothetical protein